jgi:ethanolamine utilization protein EutN
MEIGRVEGTVVSTAKSERLEGLKLLVVQLLDARLKDTGTFVVAVDSVAAGAGEIVIVVRGSSARQSAQLNNVPTDAAIIAIIDTLELGGKTIYKKHQDHNG